MVIPKKFRSVFKKTSFMPLGWGGMALLTSACSQSGTSHMDQRGNNSFTRLTHACDQLKRLSVDEEENSKDGVFKYPFISGVTTRSGKRNHNGLIKPAKQELLFSRNRCNFIFSTVTRDIKKRKKGKDIKKFLTEMCGSKENIKNVINTVKNKKGKTLLHKAAKYDHIDAIKLLLELGADINARDNKLSTPLHKAIKKRNINTIKELLYNGPHMYPENNRETPRDMEGNTLWALAKRVGDLQLIQLLDHIHINNEEKNYINKRKRES